MKKLPLIIIIITLIAITLIFTWSYVNKNSSNSNTPLSQNINSNQNSQTQNSQENIIEMSSSGFSPETLTISKGEKVIFKAVDSSNKWPASAMHPTHKIYPNSDIQKCGTSEEQIIFDSCKGIPQGETYEFIFNELGTWDYHDHLRASKRGKIIVE